MNDVTIDIYNNYHITKRKLLFEQGTTQRSFMYVREINAVLTALYTLTFVQSVQLDFLKLLAMAVRVVCVLLVCFTTLFFAASGEGFNQLITFQYFDMFLQNYDESV
jgi:hypothetical protein